MRFLVGGLIGFIAFQHLAFLVLEMFFWTKPLGLKIFGRTQLEADSSAILAANQGLYNGFLAAGLIWSLLISDPGQAFQVRVFFLGCVLVAGVFGGLTAKASILVVQALPALIGLLLVFFG